MRTSWSLPAAPLVLLAGALAAPTPACAQDSPAPGSWDSDEAVDLVLRATARRSDVYRAQDGLEDYRAEAHGYVYFFLDLPEEGERILVRTDQVALDLAWRAPDLTKQRIVGRRYEEELPTRIRYYRDRLVTVMDNFGDRIVIADGDNVRDVVHPISLDGSRHYRYRVADRVTMRLPELGEPVRVYEIEVRPRDGRTAGVVGSIFLEERNADIVRMRFTFTPAAYTDPEVDRIHVSLEHALWEGRYWLPFEQRLEVRRELRGLDLPAGSIIRARMQIGGYELNTGIAAEFFEGPPVVSLPVRRLEEFAFDRPLHAELEAEGLRPDPDLDEIEGRARAMVRERALSGLGRGRMSLPSVSDVFRFNRAEGAVFGAGLSLRPLDPWTVRVHGGWALGPRRPWGYARATRPIPVGRLEARVFGRDLADAGGVEVSSGVANTVGTIFGGPDLVDPYYRDGASLGVMLGQPSDLGLRVEAGLARHRSAVRAEAHTPVGHAPLRPVLPVDDGSVAHLGAALVHRSPPGALESWSVSLGATFGRWWDGAGEARGFGQPEFRARWERSWPELRNGRLEIAGTTATSFGSLPRQGLFLVGGRGTAPGQPFRAWGGDRYATVRASADAELLGPWVRGRLVAGAGWSGVGPTGARALAEWGYEPTGRVRAGAGIGAGLMHDILRLDLVRGFGPDGRWEWILESRRDFWSFL